MEILIYFATVLFWPLLLICTPILSQQTCSALPLVSFNSYVVLPCTNVITDWVIIVVSLEWCITISDIGTSHSVLFSLFHVR